tara:strand:- start:729 stop:908 length:180 start_codon:yes stop_codon:yes gene_type:complete
MILENLNTPTYDKKYILNNLNDFIIEIDYYDQKGRKKYKDEIPLKYILNSKTKNSQSNS